MPFDIRLRLHSDSGAKSRVLPTLSFDVTVNDSGSPALRMAVSSRVAGALEAPFLVAVEYTTGGAWVQPRNGLFIVSSTDGDSVDQTGGLSLSGEGFVPWLLRHAYLPSGSGMVDGERSFTSPGHAMKFLIDHARANGWGPNVTYDFTATLDSAGATWLAADKPPAMRWMTPFSQVLQSISELGLAEWWVQGQQLRLFRAGTQSQDRRRIRLGGKGYTRAPAKADFSDVFTDLTVLYGSNGQATNVVNPGADTRFGTLWASTTQSGVEALADAQRLAGGLLEGGRSLKRELSYEWNVIDGMPVPWVDFWIGDLVNARTLTGWREQRMVGFVIAKQSEVTVRAVVGERLLSQAARVARRAGAATVGSIISGSGDGMTTQPPISLSEPAAPTGLSATSNTATWAADGSALTKVVLDWGDVTQNIDLSDVTIEQYEVWSRTASTASSLERVTTTSTATIEGWPVGEARFVKVRARAFGGAVSAFSTEISVTPVTPTSIIPKAPTTLTAASNVGSFQNDGSALALVRLTWDAVTQGTDDSPLTIDAYELLDTTSAAYAPLQLSVERFATVEIPSGAARKYRVRARSVFGVWGDYSAEISVTGANPTQNTNAPSTPTLQTALGMVLPSWDGLLASGGLPIQFQHLIVQRAAAAGGPWTDVGVPATRAGQVAAIKEAVGSTVWIRFLWRDTLGRLSSASSSASIVVSGVTGADINAATITGNNIVAGSLTVDLLEAGAGGSLDISANGAVTTIIQSQSDLAVELAAAADTAADAAAAAEAAATAAGTAEADAAAAAAQAAAAAAQAAAAQAAVDNVQTWFRVDAAGAHVGQTGNPFQANVLPGEFNISENGVRVTWMSAGQTFVPSLVATAAAVANHKFEKYGTGTVIRTLG